MSGQVLGKITAGGGTHLISNTFYGTCTSNASSATKGVRLNDVDIDSLSLIPGMLLVVKFSYSNSASNPTLVIYNKLDGILVNSIPNKKYGSTSASTGLRDSWAAGAVVAFVYDGANWVEVSSWDTVSIPQDLGFAYLECTAPEATLTKETSTLTGNIDNGTIVAVKFTNNVLANSTLITTSNGDYPIYYKGSPIVDNIILAGDTATFIFDESGYYHLISVDQSSRVIKDNNIEVGTVPSSNHYSPVIEWVDANNEQMGYIHSQYLSGDRVRMAMGVHRDVNGSDVYRALTTSIDANGNGSMEFDGSATFDGGLDLTADDKHITMYDSRLDASYSGVPTTGANVTRVVRMADSNDRQISRLLLRQAADGRRMASFESHGYDSNGNDVWNRLGSIVTATGEKTYDVGDPAAFCKVLHVGDRLTDEQSANLSIANAVWKNVCSLSLAAGTWVIEANVQFASNAKGCRYIALSETSNAASDGVKRQTCMNSDAVNGASTFLHTGATKVYTTATTLYLVVYQNSGAALNVQGLITAVRIK